jgi:hypothetical protein
MRYKFHPMKKQYCCSIIGKDMPHYDPKVFYVMHYFWAINCPLEVLSVTTFVAEIGVPREIHRSVASHWQTLSHNVLSSTPRHEWGSNSQLKWWHAQQRTTFVICFNSSMIMRFTKINSTVRAIFIYLFICLCFGVSVSTVDRVLITGIHMYNMYKSVEK